MRVFLGKALSGGHYRNLNCSAIVGSSMIPNSHSECSKRPWREAASLIIAAPAEPTKNVAFASDYSVLYLKRTSKSSFMPNVFVYPGGAVDKADRNPQWLDVFSKVDKNFKASVIQDFFLKTVDRFHSDVFPADRVSLEKGMVPNEIAFRNCAIREAFEESGLLFLTNDLESRKRNPTAVNCESVSYLLPASEIVEWRAKVHHNADEFLNLCLHLEMVPDIWSLKEWSQWLTPVGFNRSKNAKRFLNQKARLAPPQIMENMRLLNFLSLEKLSEYICKRARNGVERWTPHIALTKDSAVLHLMPGDDAYPDDLDVTIDVKDMPTIDSTYEELEALPAKFRFRWSKDPKEIFFSLSATAKLRFGQISPVSPKSFNSSAKL